jgi:glycosyltransferase involved in cell wall biosynthesis
MNAMVPIQRDVRAMRAASSLAAAGYEVTVVDMDHEGAPTAVPALGSARLQHIKMPRWTARFYKPTHPLPWLLFKVARWARGITTVVSTRADAYHASDLAALPSCYLAARLRRKPLIYEAYELPLVQPHIARQRLLSRVAHGFLRRVVPSCAGVIAVSPPIGDEMRRLYGGPPPVILRNIPPYQPTVTSNRLREYLGLDAATRIALYQGGIQENRGLDLLVRAGKYLPAGIVVAMMGDGQSKPRLQALIEQEGVGERVRMVPAAPYAELLSWTASADLGLNVLPPDFSLSIKWCLPNKLFEYLMAGLPVLSSDLPAVAEILRTYDAGQVVASLDPQDVAQAITEMLANPTALARMRQHALEATEHDLSWEHEQQRLLGLYASLKRFPALAPQPVRMGPLASA